MEGKGYNVDETLGTILAAITLASRASAATLVGTREWRGSIPNAALTSSALGDSKGWWRQRGFHLHRLLTWLP